MKTTVRVRMVVGALGVLGAVLGSVLFSALFSAAQAAPQAAREEALPATIEFNRDIRPILSDKCYTCHGPSKQMGTLRFDREEVAKQALSGGRFAIVPGDPAKSQILQRITATSPAVRMPMGGEALSAREIETIRKWVEQGAQWQQHWSFIPPKRPALPKVNDASWARNAIDSFVLARLEREGLKPSPPAERTTLLRRVTFDLTGLPPTPGEIDAFLADKSPNAYDKVADRLLASPRYGERMAFTWLEAARYADTNGYQSDGERFMWRWRDWVIDAFNRNMRFDRFTIEQLAGDLLPNPTLDQRIATGFNRNHRGNSEGGIVPEEYQVEYVMDRAETTGTVFLGLTVGCARCHDHKYDPIKQKDTYQLFAYFNNIPESGKARRYGNSPPFIQAPLPAQQAQLKQLDDQAAAAVKKFASLEPKFRQAQKAWEASISKSSPIYWGPSRGLVARYALNGDITAQALVAPDGKPDSIKPLGLQDGEASFVPGRMGQAASFDGKTYMQGGDVAGFDSIGYQDDPFTMAAWIYPTAASGAIVTKSADVTEPGGYGLQLKDGKVQFNYVNDWVDDGIRIESEKTLDLNQWHQVTLAYDGTRYAKSMQLYVDGEARKFKVFVDDINNSAPLKREPLRIGAGGGPQNRFHGSVEDVRIYKRALSAAEAAVLADFVPIAEIAALPEAKRSKGQIDKIRGYFLDNAAPADIQAAWTQLLETRAKRDEFSLSLPTVMVMEEMPVPRETHVLIRGMYDQPGEKVIPSVPGFLASTATSYPANRLGLAQWLVNPSNPLMARVTVNRFWQMYFGTGIVKTVEDFGSQGDAPSNPELLDWLATEFVRTGWDVKAFQKTIVMSATYQQSSKTTPEMGQRDPENRLLSHGPRFRLPAPMVRDQALALSGLLVNQIGGPSVMPYQPDGLWADLSAAAYKQDHGDKLYRRSLYTFWKRTIPPPTMATFDASSRESCVVRQNLTNTPLQALDLMNDVAFLEAARVLAQRVMEEGGARPEERIAYAFRRITGRAASNGEIKMLLDSFNFQLDAFQSKPDAALKYVSQGEYPRDPKLNVSQLAAYTTLTSFILNLDETSTKE